MGLSLRIIQDIGNNQSDSIKFTFDDGMTIFNLKKIVEKIRYRLTDSKSYRFIIETSETITDEEAVTNEPNVHVIAPVSQ